jgi:predicted DNA-binding transcriptional regulator AlpA
MTFSPPLRQLRADNRAACRAQASNRGRRVLSFRQWCELNGFSERTGRRILESGTGPRVIQLSERRIGILEADNEAWQETRVR